MEMCSSAMCASPAPHPPAPPPAATVLGRRRIRWRRRPRSTHSTHFIQEGRYCCFRVRQRHRLSVMLKRACCCAPSARDTPHLLLIVTMSSRCSLIGDSGVCESTTRGVRVPSELLMSNCPLFPTAVSVLAVSSCRFVNYTFSRHQSVVYTHTRKTETPYTSSPQLRSGSSKHR